MHHLSCGTVTTHNSQTNFPQITYGKGCVNEQSDLGVYAGYRIINGWSLKKYLLKSSDFNIETKANTCEPSWQRNVARIHTIVAVLRVVACQSQTSYVDIFTLKVMALTHKNLESPFIQKGTAITNGNRQTLCPSIQMEHSKTARQENWSPITDWMYIDWASTS